MPDIVHCRGRFGGWRSNVSSFNLSVALVTLSVRRILAEYSTVKQVYKTDEVRENVPTSCYGLSCDLGKMHV